MSKEMKMKKPTQAFISDMYANFSPLIDQALATFPDDDEGGKELFKSGIMVGIESILTLQMSNPAEWQKILSDPKNFTLETINSEAPKFKN